MFTVQGGMERHTEALLASIAKAVSKEEGTSLAEAKSEIIQAVTLSLARSAAKAVNRRRPAPVARCSELQRSLQEATILDYDDTV